MLKGVLIELAWTLIEPVLGVSVLAMLTSILAESPAWPESLNVRIWLVLLNASDDMVEFDATEMMSVVPVGMTESETTDLIGSTVEAAMII